MSKPRLSASTTPETSHSSALGSVRRVVRKAADPWLRLSLGEDGLELRAELRGVAGDCVWPVDGETLLQPTGSGLALCDAELMQEVREAISGAGFQPSTAPGRYWLSGLARADQFLDRRLPRWRDSGWTIELEAPLRALLEGRRQVRSRVALRAAEHPDWFELSWRLEAGGRPLTTSDIRALRLFRGRFFKLDDGQTVSVQRGVLKRQIDELMEIGYQPLQGGRQLIRMHFLPRAAALSGEEGAKLQESIRLSSGVARLRETLDNFAGPVPVDPPPHLAETLRGYQREGLNFLNFLSEHRFGGILADDMGLGKTLQTLALLELHRLRRGSAANLVICPTSVAPNWIEECQRFTPSMKAVYLRSSKELANCVWENHDVAVISYALAQRRPPRHEFRFLVLDEAQNIKNPQAKRTRAVKSIRSERRLALSGTPIENSLAELWSLFDFLMPGFLGGQTHFERRYRRPLEREEPDPQRMEELVRKVSPFVLRRLKSQVAAELPPKSEQNIYCEMSRPQKKLYREAARAVRGQVEREIQIRGWEKSRINILAALLRLRQLCCHPSLIDPAYSGLGSAKLNAFLDLMNSMLACGGRVVVFSQFVQMLKILGAALRKRGVDWLYLDGSSRDRQGLVRRFQRDLESPVFLMSLKAGGTGVNLTAADYVVLFDPWWNPAVENQAIDRIHRIGQKRPVTAYRMIVSGTIEEKMLEMKKRKQELADQILPSGRHDLRGLTREELEELLSC